MDKRETALCARGVGSLLGLVASMASLASGFPPGRDGRLAGGRAELAGGMQRFNDAGGLGHMWRSRVLLAAVRVAGTGGWLELGGRERSSMQRFSAQILLWHLPEVR